jgi:hypothetical protein
VVLADGVGLVLVDGVVLAFVLAYTVPAPDPSTTNATSVKTRPSRRVRH